MYVPPSNAETGPEVLRSHLEALTDRPAADIDGVARGLSESADPRERAVAEIVESRRPAGS